jgi:hypothetical protein
LKQGGGRKPSKKGRAKKAQAEKIEQQISSLQAEGSRLVASLASNCLNALSTIGGRRNERRPTA